MQTLTLTYRKEVTKPIVLQSLSKRLESKELTTCYGSLAYLSLFLLPEFELEDKKVYSIEMVCTHSPGLITMMLHEILEILGNLALGVDKRENLRKILEHVGFYECFELLGVIPKDWYRAFMFEYYEGHIPWSSLLQFHTYDSLHKEFLSKEGLTFV